MNIEEIPLRKFAAWVFFGVACVMAAIILGYDVTGMTPFVFLFAFLVVFRAEQDRITDAELEAWLANA